MAKSADKLLDSLRTFAQALPDATAGIACEGTPLEKRTLKVRGKAFLFIGPGDLMLKLGASLPDAAKLVEEHPATVKAGAGGWVSLKFTTGMPPISARLLKAWIQESYDLLATKPGRKSAKR